MIVFLLCDRCHLVLTFVGIIEASSTVMLSVNPSLSVWLDNIAALEASFYHDDCMLLRQAICLRTEIVWRVWCVSISLTPSPSLSNHELCWNVWSYRCDMTVGCLYCPRCYLCCWHWSLCWLNLNLTIIICICGIEVIQVLEICTSL